MKANSSKKYLKTILGVTLLCCCTALTLFKGIRAEPVQQKYNTFFLKDGLDFLDRRFGLIIDAARIEAILEHIKLKHFDQLVYSVTDPSEFENGSRFIIKDLEAIAKIKQRYPEYTDRNSDPKPYDYHLHGIFLKEIIEAKNKLIEASRYVNYGDSDRAKKTLSNSPLSFRIFNESKIYALYFRPSIGQLGFRGNPYTDTAKRSEICGGFFLCKELDIGSGELCSDYGSLRDNICTESRVSDYVSKEVAKKFCLYVYADYFLFISRIDENKSPGEYLKIVLEDLEAKDTGETMDVFGNKFSKYVFRKKGKNRYHTP